MNECNIYYDSLSHYNDPTFLTKRTLKTILLDKNEHAKQNDGHIFQFKLAPKENTFR